MRIALIADTHLSNRSPECVANWHAAGRAVQRLSPSMTIHLGDITLDGKTSGEELAFSADLMKTWPSEIRCVPGNHDMGDASGEAPLNAGLLDAYEQIFGPDHWALTAPGWLLLGLNAQLFGSGTEQEHAQWNWLEEQASRAAMSHWNTALFLHRPVLRPDASEHCRNGRYLARASADRLLNGPLRETLCLVVSGHTHQYLDFLQDGVRHLWMPSSAFVIPDDMQVRVGEKVVGIGVLDVGADCFSFELWCPDGMVRHEAPRLRAFSRPPDRNMR